MKLPDVIIRFVRNRKAGLKRMKFTKMQGLGNDYVYISCFEETVKDPSALSVMVSDRHFGIGSDGLVLILPGERADFRMRMFNADGSEAQMCGNAARCVGRYVYERGLTEKTDITLETGSGVRNIRINAEGGKVSSIAVDMGAPELRPSAIPVRIQGERAVSVPVEACGFSMKMTCVSMGNPHAVIFVDDADTFPVDTVGPVIENMDIFPERTNVEFVTVRGRNELRMRVWERGSGETMACGTGACATLVAAVLNGAADRKAAIVLNGGILNVMWPEDGASVIQEGKAEFVFDGGFILPEQR